MNKKQAMIIVALVVLIACAGVLASMANNPLYVDVNNGTNSAISFSKSTKASTTDFYAATKLTRDNASAQNMQNLKSIIDDTNVPVQSKADATKKFTAIADTSDKEMKIEAVLKTKGFDDVICFVSDNKVTVIVKSKDPQLTDKQTKLIKSVILDETKIINMDISVK